jgi:hypothetical protein
VLDVRLTGDIIVEENFPAFINNIPVNNITLPKSCWMHYRGDPVIYMIKGSATERLPFQQSESAVNWSNVNSAHNQHGYYLLQYTLPQGLRVNQYAHDPRYYDFCWSFYPPYRLPSVVTNNTLLSGSITLQLPPGYRAVSKNSDTPHTLWFNSANWPASIEYDIAFAKSRTSSVFHYSISIDNKLTPEQQLAAVQGLTFAFTLRLFLDNPDLNPQIDKPSWQAYEEYSVGLGFIYFAIGLVVPILPLIIYYANSTPEPMDSKILELGHEKRVHMLTRLSPALLGTLVHNRVSRREVLATVLDLSRRNYLVIEQRQEDFIIRLTGDPRSIRDRVPLHQYEEHLLTSLVNEEVNGNNNEQAKPGISFKQLKHRMRAFVPQFESLIYQSLHHAGYINPPSQVRAKYRVLAMLVLCFALISYYVTDLFFADDITTLPFMFAMLLLTALEFYSIKDRCSILTKRGSKYYHHAMLMKRHLEQTCTKNNASPLYLRALFDEYLPYTAVLDIDAVWAAQWDLHIHPSSEHYYYPHWFIVPLEASGTPSFVDRYQNMAQQMTRSMLKILLK